MAKGQQKSNKEVKKPKKEQVKPSATANSNAGGAVTLGATKKK